MERGCSLQHQEFKLLSHENTADSRPIAHQPTTQGDPSAIVLERGLDQRGGYAIREENVDGKVRRCIPLRTTMGMYN